jgi:hypothetical protein
MHQGKVKKSSDPHFLSRTTLAKKLGKPVSTIERLLFRGVIVPDAWIIETSQSHPLFAVERVKEIEGTITRYFTDLGKGRLQKTITR